ncbi:hypothetical protein CEXT_520991, partial [Caerostris extrusa]
PNNLMHTTSFSGGVISPLITPPPFSLSTKDDLLPSQNSGLRVPPSHPLHQCTSLCVRNGKASFESTSETRY